MIRSLKTEIRYVEQKDKDFWFLLDKHISFAEFNKKVRDRQGYILSVDGRNIGLLRYNLFWDNTPFCNLLYIMDDYQRQGFGKTLMAYWENEMKSLKYTCLLSSTRVDEDAKFFYKAIGYDKCGVLNAPNQPAELLLCKYI